MPKQTEFEKQVFEVIRQSLGEAIRKQLGDGYHSPLKALVADAIKVNDEPIRRLLYSSIAEILADDSFKQTMREHIKKKVAKEITNTFGEGVFKRAIDNLKSDPTLKARCIVAVEKIIEGLED